jgi:hypothetical protein
VSHAIPPHRPPSTQSIILGVVLIVMAIIVGTQSGCGPNARRTTLASEFVALKAARDTFTTWDRQHQMGILEKADPANRADYDKQIAAYRELQAVIVHAFEVAFSQIAEAATDDKKPMPKPPDAMIKILRVIKPGDPPPVLCGSGSTQPGVPCIDGGAL